MNWSWRLLAKVNGMRPMSESKADTRARIGNVRFALKSGQAESRHQCLLSAKSGQRQSLLMAPNRQITNGLAQGGKDSDAI